MYFREIAKAARKIWPQNIVSSTANSPQVIATAGSEALRVQCTTGAFQVSTLTTAPTSTDGWALNEGEYMDLRSDVVAGATPASFVAMVAATTTATYQMVAWKD